MIDKSELLDKILDSYTAYYDIKRDGIEEPFFAEAEFHSHDERYFISKSAKLFESESNEYVFFAEFDELDILTLEQCDALAWQRGLDKVDLNENHKSTDVTLVVIANNISDECKTFTRKIKHYKSYMFTLKGWSNYRLITIEASTKNIFTNRMGADLKERLSNIVAS